MKKSVLFLSVAAVVLGLTTGCSSTARSLSDPGENLNVNMQDIEILGTVEGEAEVTMVLGIIPIGTNGTLGTFEGRPAAAPSVLANIVGSITGSGGGGMWFAQSQAIYDALSKNPEADIIIYPKYNTKAMRVPILFSKYKVKVHGTAAKIKR